MEFGIGKWNSATQENYENTQRFNVNKRYSTTLFQFIIYITLQILINEIEI